jgi:hypothetical protein
MLQDSTARLPRAGEPVVLADGRRFVFAEIQNGVRGWWFLATAEDGASTLQGNLRLEWDSPAQTWRPAATHVPTPRSMSAVPQTRRKQVD